MNVELSVLVCTYNRAEILPFCLESLAHQTLDSKLYEVIVVNNLSTDNTQEIAEGFEKSYPHFRTCIETKQGLSNARNRALKEACGNYVCYIDDDAKADPKWCENILNCFETVKPQPIAVGGIVQPWFECKPPKWYLDEYESFSLGEETHFLTPPNAKYGFCGNNMAFLKSALEKYNGFSNQFGMIGKKIGLGEETELFLKMFEDNPANSFWYDPNISIEHWVPKWKLTIRYRLRRSFCTGRTSAQLDGEKYIISRLGSAWRGFLRDIFRQIFTARLESKEIVKRTLYLSSRLGYLLEKSKDVGL